MDELKMALVILTFGFVGVVVVALTMPPETITQTERVTYPCADGRVTSSHLTPAGDSLFTVLCPKEGYDGEH